MSLHRRLLPLLSCVLLLIGACTAWMEKPASRPLPPKPSAQPSKPLPSPGRTVAAPSIPPKPTADRTPKPTLPMPPMKSIDDCDMASLDAAIEKSLRYYDSMKDSGIHFGNRTVSTRDLKESLTLFREIVRSPDAPEIKWSRIRNSFDFISSSGQGRNGGVLFTGYYAPVLDGSPVRTSRYRYPVYRKPDDLIAVSSGKANGNGKGEPKIGRMGRSRLIPYYSRDEIDRKGVLESRGLELAWVDDPIALYSLHVQGSGKIRMTNGETMIVSYAQSNGRPFRPISRTLVEKRKMTVQDISYPNIQNYLREHPEELQDLFSYNERYIFFRRTDGGPMGSLQFPVTTGRTIATDPDYYPKGALALIETRKPLFDASGQLRQWVPLSRFVLSQDAGAAIKGTGRVDIFCGEGQEAEQLAGSFKEKGELYILIRKK